MQLRQWMINPDEAPAWLFLLVLGPVAVVAGIVISALEGPWWTVPIPVGVAAAIWQSAAGHARARGKRPAD